MIRWIHEVVTRRAAVVLLAAFSCCATMTPTPRTIVLESTSDLPADLAAESEPCVRVYLRNGTRERIDALCEKMKLLGYHTDDDHPSASGAADLLFIARPTEVLQGQSEVVCWAAAKLIIDAGIPFTWGSTQYASLFVPGPLAAGAREVLGRDPQVSPSVIESDGSLRRDAAERAIRSK